MIKGKEILGRNIVALSSGEKVDTVRDVVFDHQGNQVLALLVDEGGWFRAARAVPFERIRSIGEDAIMIGSPDDVTSSRDDKRLGDALDSKTNLLGMTLLTTDGQNLGRIADVYFDEHSGAVVGYEATGGLFADISSGRAFVPAPSDVQIGSDAAIVPLSVAHAMKENPGGLRGAFRSVGDSVTGGVQQASETVSGAVQSAGSAVQSAGESVRGGVASASDSVRGVASQVAGQARDTVTERQQDYVVGKVSNTEIVAADGTVIVREGETITPLHAEVAEWHGQLPELAAAATGGTLAGAVDRVADRVRGALGDLTQATRERQKDFVVGKTAGADLTLEGGAVLVHKGQTITAAHAEAAEEVGKLGALTAAATGGAVADAYADTRERVQEGYAQVREGAQDRYEDLQDATAERQKAFVVGKVAGRNVLTDSGELIVAGGVTITPFQADRAEATGTLGALLGAVAVGPVAAAPAAGQVAAPVLTVQDTLGCRVRRDVRAPGGSLLAVQGQIVTPEIVARAQQLGLEDQLIEASAEPQTPAGSDLAAGASAALAGGVATVSEGASTLLSKAKTWLHDLREESETALSTREAEYQDTRVQSALGRPVTRVILAPDDAVILNVGEVVTNKAVQAARAGGVLEMLLDSVSHDAPHIDPLASRPAETGQAALGSQPEPKSKPE